MMINEFREVIKQRERIEAISSGEWADGIERCWQEEIKILSEDIESTIDFLNNHCTASEYSWISEIIEDLIEQTQSKELLECYKSLMNKFSDECNVYNIEASISFAESMLEK